MDSLVKSAVYCDYRYCSLSEGKREKGGTEAGDGRTGGSGGVFAFRDFWKFRGEGSMSATVRLGLLFFCSVCFFVGPGHAQQKNIHVLVMHSYAMDYGWTEELHKGILDAFTLDAPSSSFRMEFMDTKNFFSQDYMDALVRIYAEKYAGVHFDGIIVTDNNALDFMALHGAELFPGVPVVACGINDARLLKNTEHITSIIAEEADHAGTLMQAWNYWPSLGTVYVVSDATPTDRSIVREVQQTLAASDFPFRVVLVPNRKFEELKGIAATRASTDLIYLLPFFRDGEGKTFVQGQAARELAAVSRVPILVSWHFQLGTGVLGGRIISPRILGSLAVRTLFEIIQGHTVPRLQTDVSVYENVYDHTVMERYSIPEALLPQDAVILNKPLSFYEKHARVLVPGAVLLGILSVLVWLLFQNLKKQQRINAGTERERVLLAKQTLLHQEHARRLLQLSMGVAHQIRNPLMVIGGFTSLLRRKVRDVALFEYLDGIRENTVRLSDIVKAVVDYTSIRVDHSIRMEVAECVTESPGRWRAGRKIPAGHVVFDVRLEPCTLTGDRARLEDALFEIFDNAYDFKKKETVSIVVRGQCTSDGFELTIRDNGPGIPEDVMPSVLDPFFTTRAVGVGMGLCSVEKTIREHGGDLRLGNAPEGGVIVRIVLPRTVTKEP